MVVEQVSLSPVGYRVVLPPGWVRIPLRSGTEPAIDAILERNFAQLPRDSSAGLRRELRALLLTQAAKARDEGEGLDLLLPVEQAHGLTLAASAVVAEFTFDGVEVDPGYVLTAILAEAGSSGPVMLDGSSGARTERVVAADPARQAGSVLASRRVDYVLAVPNDPGHWVTVSFSTLGDGAPDSEVTLLLVDLFDAIMGTWRWQRS